MIPNTYAAEISLEWQVQRVGRELIHKQHLKTDGSTDVLPLPDICLAALKLQRKAQDRLRTRLEQGGGTWPRDGLVFTTRTGRAIEPRAVSRRFDLRCAKAGVRRIRVHDTRPRLAVSCARHFPSRAVRVIREIWLWMWSCGSPSRLVPCSHELTISPAFSNRPGSCPSTRVP